MPKIAAETLIELAIQTLKTEVRDHVGADGRYPLAMSVNALETARREILCEPEAATWALLDDLYDDGEGSLKELAKDIRVGTINDESHPQLRERLEKHLIAELEVRNPGALKARAQASE
ncbi:MAG: DUF6285 domain-containing protein [Pseudomonadota bacterium]